MNVLIVPILALCIGQVGIELAMPKMIWDLKAGCGKRLGRCSDRMMKLELQSAAERGRQPSRAAKGT